MANWNDSLELLFNKAFNEYGEDFEKVMADKRFKSLSRVLDVQNFKVYSLVFFSFCL
jgi:hypothetical protein